MPTRLYFRDAAHSLTGTFPGTEQSTAVANWTANNTLKTLEPTTGTAMVSHTGTSTATTAAQSGMMGRFVSRPLSGAQTVGGSPMVMNVADSEGNLASNFWVNAIHVFVWRPSTGALVGTVVDSGGTSLGGLEPSSASSIQVTHLSGISTSAVAAQTGDVIIVEVWSRFTQSMGTAYSSSFYFGGSTENTTENAVVSNHASFIEFAENLVLTKTVSLAGSVTGAASVAAASISNTPKSYELVATTTGAATAPAPSNVKSGDILLAMGFRDGSTVAPTVLSGWSSIATQTGTSSSAVLASAPASFEYVPSNDLRWLTPIKISAAASANGLFVVVGSTTTSTGREIFVSNNAITWTRTYFNTTGSLLCVAYGDGVWVVGGNSGVLLTSSDGVNWESRTSGTSASITSIAYGGGRWVGATSLSTGETITSTNSINWTANSTGVAQDLTGVAYDGTSTWAVVGNNGTILTSTDGQSWTNRSSTSGTTSRLNAVAYGGGRWGVALQNTGVRTSADLVTWSATVGSTMCSITYNNSLWVAGTAFGAVMTSSDGTTWSTHNTNTINSSIYSIFYESGLWWILHEDSIIRSTVSFPPSYTTYLISPYSTPEQMLAVSYGNGLFVSVGSGGYISTSADGVTWTTRTSGTTSQLNGVAYGAGRWVVALQSSGVRSTTDFITWSASTGSTMYAVTYGNGLWIAVGINGTIRKSTNGTSWTTVTSGVTATLYAVTYGNGLFVAVGASGTIVSSPDGDTWTNLTSTSGTSGNLNGVAYGAGRWVVALQNTGMQSTTDFTTWSSTTGSTMYAVAYGNGYFVAGGAGGSITTSTDGITWVSRSTSSKLRYEVLGIAYGGGNVVAVGPLHRSLAPTELSVTIGFTNATAVVCNVYRGLDSNTPIGAITSTVGTGTSVTLPATPYISKNSAVAAFVGHSSPDVTFPSNTSYGATSPIGIGSLLSFATSPTAQIATPDGVSNARYSTNGITWASNSVSTSPIDDTIYFAPFGGFLGFLSSASTGYFGSTDGTSWTAGSFGGPTISSATPSVANSVLFLFSQSATTAYYTLNGTTWTSFSIPTGGNWLSVAYGNGIYCSVSFASSQGAMSSPDGVNWTYAATSQSWYRVVFYNGKFVAIGKDGSNNIILGESTNGTTFTVVKTFSITSNWFVTGFVNNQNTIVFLYTDSSGNLNALYSFDGTNWLTLYVGGNTGSSINYHPASTSNTMLVPVFNVTYAATFITLRKNQSQLRITYADATNEAASYDTGGTLG